MGEMPAFLTRRPKDSWDEEPVLHPGDPPSVLPPMKLDPLKTPGIFHVQPLSQDSADMCADLLGYNHTAHHIFTLPEHWKGTHLHNHIVHHTFALWSLGATPQQMKDHVYRNTLYQRKPLKETDAGTVKDLTRIFSYRKHLGNETYYQDYVHFFEHEISELGYQAVLQKYLVGDNDLSYDMLPRMFMGYVHSMMHVGMGLEYKQAKILAEGFAQAVVHHDYWYTDFLHQAEDLGKKGEESALSLVECVDLAAQHPTIKTCSTYDYQRQFEGEGETRAFVMRKEMIKDGVCGKGFEPLKVVAARYRVDPNDLERETAALINAACFLVHACQFPPHECRPDFFLMHGSNVSIWLSVFLAEPSLSPSQKARLIEYTGRTILMLYAGMGCPDPRMEWVMCQKPVISESANSWPVVLKRATEHPDDGHMSKLIRVTAHCQQISKKYDHLPEFPLKQDMFLPAANAALDGLFTTNNGQPMSGTIHWLFVRGCGWPEAWANVPELSIDRRILK